MSRNHFDLDGRVAIVSGASRGIGESIARILAEYGAHVVVSSRKQEGCDAVAQSINDDGGKATAIACHVGEIDSIDNLVKQTTDQLGRIDILVNNAATNPFFGHILDTPLSAAEKTIDVNIRGFFYMSQQAGLVMKEQKKGVIINTASINGRKPALYQGIYSITKGAIINMTQAFAKECAQDGIRCNALLPGLTRTKFAAALTENDEILEHFMPHIPMQRVGVPDDMAGAVLFMVSDAASYMTGECLAVDGGYLA